MMRRGLWQQKQKPSACLLCRYSYTYGYGSNTRTALRAPSNPDDRTYSTRPYLSGLKSTRHGGLGSTASPRRPLGVGTPFGSASLEFLQRPLSTGGMPSWATQEAPTASSNDGLLPHERAARERAMSRTRPPPAAEEADRTSQPAKRAARAPTPKARGPAWASPAPSWPAAPTPAPAQSSVTSSAVSGPDTPNATQPADPFAGLLPHERAARAAARAQGRTPASPPRITARTNPDYRLAPHDDKAREYVSIQSRRRRPFGLMDPQQAPSSADSWRPGSRDAPGPASRRDFRESRENGATSREFQGRSPETGNKSALPEFELARPASSYTRTPADEGEWRNLTRRVRKPPAHLKPLGRVDDQGFQTAPLSGEITSEPVADPWKTFQDSVTTQASSATAPTASGEDQWELIEQNAKREKKMEKKAARASTSWDWADQYEEDARQAKVQKVAREIQQGTRPANQEDGSNLTGSREERDGRYGRGDREERVDRRERKPKPRQRRTEIEDDFDDDYYEERKRRKAEKAERERQKQAALEEAGPTPIFLPEFISVTNLATALGQDLKLFVSQLEELGFEDVSKDNILTGETAALVAQEYGFEPTVDAGEDEDLKPAPAPADPSSLPLRPPVVTIMGHVDHGKTTLLDYLRKSSIVSQEHGGITQHIGAFSVNLSSGKLITFLDTPGHAAFLSMRQRGANVTDMVILVVAADDSVMPQTLEALKHARAAKVPLIVAINKVDKPEANVERVKADLAQHGVEIEDYGGDVQVVCVSGRTGQGMPDLEENILLLSEMLDIRAETGGMAEGWVLESTIKPIGRVATVLVKRGTLRPGDFVVAGRVHAKVRSLRNEAGVEVDEAPPGTAVEVLGWKEPPEAGDQVLQAPDEGKAKAAVRYRQEVFERGEVISQMAQQEQERRERERERALAEANEIVNGSRGKGGNRRGGAATTQQDEATADATDGDGESSTTPSLKHLTFLVKGDVHGSVEAVTAALLEQGNNEIRAKVLLSAPGKITESDVEHAAVSGSAIVNFNNDVPSNIKRLAHDAGVAILEHNIIYHLVEDVRQRLADALPPLVVKKVVGEAEVLQVFPINVKGRRYKNIAGCRVGNGVVKRGSRARVIRGGENIFEGVIETLKHVKKDVDEMKKGTECGMSFADWDELQPGDQIQVIEEYKEKRKL